MGSGFSNEAFQRKDKRGGKPRHERLRDENKSEAKDLAERYRVKKNDTEANSSPLKQGSLKADTIDFLQGIVSLTMWIPELEQALEREGFVKETQDGNRHAYSYPVPAGGLKDFTFTPEEALEVLKSAMKKKDVVADIPVQAQDTEKKTTSLPREEHATQKKEGNEILSDTIKKGMESVRKEKSVIDAASIPFGHGKLARESIEYIRTMLLGNKPPITAELLKILKYAGYSAEVMRVTSGVKNTPKKVRVSLMDDRSRVWELTQQEIIDLLKRHIKEQGEKSLAVENEKEIPMVNDGIAVVDESKVINPYGKSGDLEKSDQGGVANKLDINDFRKIQYKQEEERRADVDFVAEQEKNVEKERLFSLSEQKKLEQEREGRVVASETFEELEDVIREIGDIQGSKKAYPAENEILRIKAFRERYVTAPMEVYEAVLNLFTNTYHLRDKIDQLIKKERKMLEEKIRQEAEEDVVVRGFDKEAFDFPERYDAVWNRFVATHPEKAVLYRGHNPGIRSALERKEVKDDIPKAEPKPEKQNFFDVRFETEFGITEEQIFQIEGYERLSEGQQKLVLENLREYARDTRGGYLSRAWEGILKSTGREAKDKNYVEAVTVLIRNTAQFGPKVHEENGELLTDFIDVGIPQQFRKEHKPIFDRFNALAHQYAKLKVEDLEDGIGTHSKDESKFVSFLKNTFSESRRKHDAYESLQESYENAKRELAQSLAEIGKLEGEVAEKLIEIDSKVHSLRFLQTEPEAVDVLKQNPDKGFWQKVGEKVFSKENLTYAGLGFVGRMALTGAMGLYAAPVVASAVGGIRSWNKTSAELREKDRMARGGTRDISGEALNIVDVTREIKVGQDGKKDVGLTQKLLDLIREYQNEDVKEGRSGGEKTKTLERIRARVAYVEDKLNLNRINFGSGAERATNMASLFEALGEARVLLADTEMPKGSELEGRLERYLISREGLIQTRRRKKQIKTAAWGTLKAGAFALAGRELAEYVQETGFFSKEEGVAGGVAGGVTSVPQSAEAPLPKQYGYQAEVRAIDNEIVRKSEMLPEDHVEIGTKDVSAEPAPKPVGPSSPTPSVHVPSSQAVEELQKASAESGSEDKLYSDAESDMGNEKSSPSLKEEGVKTSEGGDVSDTVSKEQKGESPVRSEEVSSVEEQPKSPTSSESIGQASMPPDEIIEIKGYPPIKTIEANDHVFSKVPEEGVRIPKDLEDVSDTVPEAQAESGSSRPYAEESSVPEKDSSVLDAGTSSDNSVESDIRRPESTIPDYSKDGGTVLDSESNTPEAKSIQSIPGSQETFKNTHGVEVNPKKEHIYELTGQGGEKVMVSYGGKDFGTRFDTAQEYVQKNPEAVVVVEEEPRYGVFGQKLPPSYVEVRNIPGEGVTTVFSIQDSTLPASSEKGIDPSTFTKKVTK